MGTHVSRPTEWLAHRLLYRSMSARYASRLIAVSAIAIALVAGVVMHWVEPTTYPNVWLGLWWAVQTVTSVGYGDLVPQSVSGRLLAILVMVAGIALLSIVIAAVSAAFVEGGRRRAERARLIEDPVRDALRRVEERLDAIERKLER